MSQGQELELKTPVVDITARNDVEETSQNLLEDSRTIVSGNSSRPGAFEVVVGAGDATPGAMEVPTAGAQEFNLNLDAHRPGATEIVPGASELVADIRDPAAVEADLANFEAGAVVRLPVKEATPASASSHDLEALILGGPVGWGLYRATKETLDPVIDTTGKISFQVSTGTLPKLADNIVNKPLTTALEFIVCPALPFVHASINAANDANK